MARKLKTGEGITFKHDSTDAARQVMHAYEIRPRADKRGQLFIRTDDETLSVVAVRICNPDRSPLGING